MIRFDSGLQGIKLLCISLCLITILLSCNNGGKTTIRGNFSQFNGKIIYLSEVEPKMSVLLDSARLSRKGDFTFRFKRDSAGIYLLKFDNRTYITLVLDKETNVKVSSTSTNIRSDYQVEGSADSRKLQAFEKFYDRSRQVIDSITSLYSRQHGSQQYTDMKRNLDTTYNRSFEEQRRQVMAFLDSNCSSLASIVVLDKRFGQRKVLSEESDYKYFIRLDSCLSLKYPGNNHVSEFHSRVEKLKENQQLLEYREKRLAIGNKAPDISLQNLNGKEIALSSLRGKNVLIYFWASWDSPSRKANPKVLNMVNANKSKNLVVYAISLDSYKEMWENAIRSDNLSGWIHVSELMNIYSGSLSLFNVPKKYPYYYLLDKERIIRYKGGDLDQLSYQLNRL